MAGGGAPTRSTSRCASREGMAASGRLAEEPMERALAALEVFAHFCRASGLDRGHDRRGGDERDPRREQLATSSSARAREAAVSPIRVLSTEQEARYGYHRGGQLDDARGRLRDGPRRRLAPARAGEGGHARVGLVAAGRGADDRALPAGSGPAKESSSRTCARFVAEELRAASPGSSRAQRRRVVGIGGALRNLADAAQRAAGLPSLGVQGARSTAPRSRS